ncbi:hypothetical protein [Cellulomonas fimi]|uniref:hypothetical protein n=1 Tax=Cellulomonas fimi TaxID=1708 RepID=UPI0002DA81EF|nr:hypothetical protein [Cellulomonas fimi]NNH06654.1 hypothetical protein [Cellulomonas fimi]
MYLIGHAILTRDSGAFTEEEIFDGRLATLMLPDFVNCHDWAYTKAWRAEGEKMRLIQAHMLADWYVHFGAEYQQERVRRGWAYRSMRPATRRYWQFFAEAHALGLRDTAEPNDSVRGFAHTMLEYLVDLHLARSGTFDRYFDQCARELDKIDDETWLTAEVHALAVEGSDPDLHGVAARYKSRASRARSPEEIALLGLCSKFALALSWESVAYVRQFQETIYREVGADAVAALVDEVTHALADPSTFRWADAHYTLSVEPADQ